MTSMWHDTKPDPTRPRLDLFVEAGLSASSDAIVLTDDRVELTGNQVMAGAVQMAAELRDAGAAPGDAVLLAVDNRAHDIVGQLAIWSVGCVAVPVHRPSPATVVGATAERTASRLLVGTPAETWTQLVAASGEGVHALHTSQRTNRPDELDSDQALVIFTSGSTGRPKGVVISHRAFVTKLQTINEVLNFTPGATMLQVLHMHFSFGQWTTLLTLASGGRIDLVRRFSPGSVLERLARSDYDRIAVVPTMMRMMEACLAEPQFLGVLADLKRRGSPRLWIAGGEPLPAGLGRHFRTLLPDSSVTDVFGLSESATSDFIVRPDQYDEQAGTIGRPTPGVRAKVMVETAGGFVEAADNERGELWLLTPHLMTGYLDDAAATDATLEGPWLRTGDLAVRRPEGLLELVGRAKNLIVRGGVKVSPLELENVFSGHPGCSGVIATGLPDDVLGERIHLLVTARRGLLVDPDEVREWGRAEIEPGKLPDHVHVVDQLPLGVTGKTDRVRSAALAAQLAAKART